MEPREGDVVTENVRLTRLLGRGGMGSVWVARHQSLDVDVAVKFVSKELLSGGDPLVVERFRREAKLAAKIESVHVVRVFDHGLTKEGTPYIVMELLRGESVAERVQRFQRMSVGDAARVVSEIASGLSAAHAIGIVHRDIKPHNVFLARARDGVEVAKILDFGIAKMTNATEEIHKAVKTSSGVLIGTPQYMSPEQLMRAGPPDASADLWALGVVAYEMVTGRVPFAGETLAATLVAITRAEIKPPSSSIPGAPAGLDAFFARALAADVSRRFATAGELAAAFAAAAGGIAAAPVIASDAPTRRVEMVNTSPDLSTAEFVALTKGEGAGPPMSGRGPEFVATAIDLSRQSGTEPKTAADTISEEPPVAAAARSDSDVTTKPSPADDELRKKTDRPPAVPERRKNRTLLIVGGAVAIVGIGAFVTGKSLSSNSNQSSTRATALVPPSAAPTGSTTTSTPIPSVAPSVAPAPRAPAPFKKQVVKDGRTADRSLWVPDFWVQRDAGDVGQAFLMAETACRTKKMALCTDSQFERACTSYGELATDAVWTSTAESGGVVVRGGAAGCAARVVVAPDDVDSSRSAMCCTRAVSLSGDLDKFGALRNVTTQIQVWENRFNLGQGDRISKDSPGSVGFFGQTLAAEKLTETIAWMSKTTRILQDQCKVSLIPQDADGAWLAICTGIELELDKSPGASPLDTRASTALKQIFQRYEFTGSGLFRDVRTWQHPRRLIGSP